MAIYSCNVRSIGKSTHAVGTAGSHMRYICRDSADAHVEAHHIPEDGNAARAWMDAHERSEPRKNARFCDKVMVALPIELDAVQRAALVRDFAAQMTGNRVPWYAAVHQSGKDEQNPHAHLVFVDRDIETGERELQLSASPRQRQQRGMEAVEGSGGKASYNPVDWVRAKWEESANRHLALAGHKVRIDRRSLEDQGIAREPTIHIGPRAQHIDANVKRPQSADKPDQSWTKQSRDQVPYTAIDQGRTRRERNAQIIDLNLEREARSADFAARRAGLCRDRGTVRDFDHGRGRARAL